MLRRRRGMLRCCASPAIVRRNWPLLLLLLLLLQLTLTWQSAIRSDEPEWILEDHSPRVTFTDALGFDTIAARGFLFSTLNSTFSTSC